MDEQERAEKAEELQARMDAVRTKPAREALAKLEAVREQADAAVKLSQLVEEQRRTAIVNAVEAGVSQSEIARRLGVSQARVNQIINDAKQ